MAETRLKAAPPQSRLEQLDGLRGLAALVVVVHHYFGREDAHTFPHAELAAQVPFAYHFGPFGILLFFLLSGFVIMMTLERCNGILDFFGRRIARLWPAMLVCATLSAILINVSGVSDYYGTDNEVSWFDWLSSIFFIPPDLLADKLGLTLADRPNWVEGVYWTLWYEVRFYALIAIVFLIAPRGWFFWLWAGVQAVSLAVLAAPAVAESLRFQLFWPELVFMPGYLGWFGLGVVGFMYWSRRVTLPVILIGILAMVQIWLRPVLTLVAPENASVMTSWGDRDPVVFPFILAAFALFLIRSPVMRFLSWRPLLAIGLASYPLYLFHEQPGLITFMLVAEAGLPSWLGPALAIPLVIVAALLIHRFMEMPGKRLIMGIWHPLAQGVERRVGLLRYTPVAAGQSQAR